MSVKKRRRSKESEDWIHKVMWLALVGLNIMAGYATQFIGKLGDFAAGMYAVTLVACVYLYIKWGGLEAGQEDTDGRN